MTEHADGPTVGSAGGSGRPGKVARLIGEYGLEGLGDELEARWTGENGDRTGLRPLADAFNRAVLAAAMEAAGMETLDGEVQNAYRLLTDDDVSAGVRTRTRHHLAEYGIDPDDLESDFVSYQAVRTYLTEHREASYDPDRRDPREEAARHIRELRGRTEAVSGQKLEQLSDAGRIALGEYRLLVDVSVFCEDCGTQYEAADLLDRGGCDCGE